MILSGGFEYQLPGGGSIVVSGGNNPAPQYPAPAPQYPSYPGAYYPPPVQQQPGGGSVNLTMVLVVAVLAWVFLKA
jgi:hypothetical protein